MLKLRSSRGLNFRALLVSISQNTSYSYSNNKKDDGYSSSDDEKEPKKSKLKTSSGASEKKNESAAERLNHLLASMQTDDAYSIGNKTMKATTKPGEAHKKRKDAAKEASTAQDVLTAAKNIAYMLGNNEEQKKQTESELLAKLLGHNVEPTSRDSKSQEIGDVNLSELIVGMKIDRRKPQEHETSRGEYVRRTLAAKKSQPQQSSRGQQTTRKQVKREAETYTGSVNLFGGERLGIFKQPEALLDTPDVLSTWAELHKWELKLQVTHPPANYFEKMILLTERGKVWRFPIDNEQDMQEEVDVDFSEHIFLEQHLESWCPNKGPIRHFMELVCVGLSKNPYITAKEKKEHILWFRDYFETKRDILKELMSKEHMNGNQQTKQLEAQ